MSIFNFELYPFKECVMSEENGKKNVCYFWITDSIFYIDLGKVKIYEISKEFMEKYNDNNPYISYQYIHFLEFFFNGIEKLALPIPKEIYEKFDTYEKWQEYANLVKEYSWHEGFEEIQDDIDNIYSFFWQCVLDGMFLSSDPTVAFYHIGDNIRIYYDLSQKDEDIYIWSAGEGMADIPYDVFVKEVKDMLDRFFIGMEKQINDIERYLKENESQDEYTFYGEDSPIESLLKENEKTKKYYYDKFKMLENKTYKYDFEKLRKDYDAVNEVVKKHGGKTL